MNAFDVTAFAVRSCLSYSRVFFFIFTVEFRTAANKHEGAPVTVAVVEVVEVVEVVAAQVVCLFSCMHRSRLPLGTHAHTFNKCLPRNKGHLN